MPCSFVFGIFPVLFIDFINLEKEEDKKELLQTLQETRPGERNCGRYDSIKYCGGHQKKSAEVFAGRTESPGKIGGYGSI